MNNLTDSQADATLQRSISAVRQNLAFLTSSLLIVCTLAVWFVANYRGYPVKNQQSPPTDFSAGRAIDLLTKILGDRSPHSAGSLANDEVRQRLVDHLNEIGLDVEQTPFEVNGVAMCNLLTSVPGDSSKRPILLASHYDSVEQGPGAGDAGCCVAALVEIARVLNEQRKSLAEQRLSREVFILLTDGEEWVRDIGHGLNGATHFVETDPHPLLARNPIVLNFDARGAAGPSLLYETSGNNSELLKQLLPALPRPAFTASSYVTVYDLLPNATDFTIFKKGGLQGLNFAFIDDPHCYHTPEDDLKNLDQRSLQHHGENGLAVTQHLLNTGLEDFDAEQSAVFFTVFGEWLVCYEEQTAVLLAIAMLVIQLLGTRVSFKRGAKVTEMIVSGFAVVLATILSVACGCIVMQFDKFRPQSFHGFGEFDTWIIGLLWILAGVASMTVLRLLAKLISNESMWACIWLGTAIVGLITSLYLPGFSYVMLATGLIPAILSLLPQNKTKLSVVAIAAASISSIPLAYQFGIALGPKMATVLSGLYVLFLLPVFPLLAPHRPIESNLSNSGRAVGASAKRRRDTTLR